MRQIAREELTSHYTVNTVELKIPRDSAGQRLDVALQRLLPEYSRARIQAWLKAGQIRVDGRVLAPKAIVIGDEVVVVNVTPQPEEQAFSPEAIALDIVYEDRSLIVINKPPGLVVHPGSGNWSGTLLNALLHYAPGLAAVPRAGIVHRLDKDTSGLMVVARDFKAQTDLVRQLQARSVRREYLALVHGVVACEGEVAEPIGRHPTQRMKMAVVERGRSARTFYEVLERYARHSLICCRLETGRTHQIRVHMQSIGHPLVGDPVYGAPGRAPKFVRQALHAERLALAHPATGAAMHWHAPPPADMQALIGALRSAQ